jgi:hypothetical protein
LSSLARKVIKVGRDWEATLRDWAKPPGKAEQAKMENAERAIRAAIDASPKLSAHKVSVVPQGSYQNLTHIPAESDVDICVVYRDAWESDWTFVDRTAATDDRVLARLREEAHSVPGAYTYPMLRADVGAALEAKFGPPPAVVRGDKAWDVHETKMMVDSDVVAAFEHRRWKRGGGVLKYDVGTQFLSDKGKTIINWPQQQYDNGVAKNTASHGRFKDLVRALKNLQVEMDEQKVLAATDIPSFLIEYLAYNAPDDRFGHPAYVEDMREVLYYLWENSKADDAPCSKWVEESELKWLLKGDKAWTRAQVHAFLLAGWKYLGFPTS